MAPYLAHLEDHYRDAGLKWLGKGYLAEPYGIWARVTATTSGGETRVSFGAPGSGWDSARR